MGVISQLLNNDMTKTALNVEALEKAVAERIKGFKLNRGLRLASAPVGALGWIPATAPVAGPVGIGLAAGLLLSPLIADAIVRRRLKKEYGTAEGRELANASQRAYNKANKASRLLQFLGVPGQIGSFITDPKADENALASDIIRRALERGDFSTDRMPFGGAYSVATT